LYEAAALGVPVVAIPVVPGQRGTVRAFASAGAALKVSDTRTVRVSDIGTVQGPSPERIAAAAATLCRSPQLSARVAARGRELVDGKGAERVAAAIERLAGGRVS
jgi:UDP-N-acetylglucosamine:LPS N-acetylglucosamine transferase